MKTRGNVSLSAETRARIAAYCKEHCCSMSQLVERLVEPVLRGEVAAPAPEAPSSVARRTRLLRVSEPPPAAAPRTEREQIRIKRTRCAARYAKFAGVSLREAATVFGLHDLEWVRAAWRWMYPNEEPVRYRAPEPTAVAVPQFPPGAVCALCCGDCVGALHREPLGRDGGMVNVCSTCATEVPREGQYAFGCGARAGIGDGNRHTRAASTGGPR